MRDCSFCPIRVDINEGCFYFIYFFSIFPKFRLFLVFFRTMTTRKILKNTEKQSLLRSTLNKRAGQIGSEINAAAPLSHLSMFLRTTYELCTWCDTDSFLGSRLIPKFELFCSEVNTAVPGTRYVFRTAVLVLRTRYFIFFPPARSIISIFAEPVP